MATKQCDKFEFEDDLEIIEVWNDDLKPPPNTPVPSPYQAPVAWGMKSNTSEKDVYCPILYDVSNSKPNSSVFGFGNEPRTKYHHSVHWYSNLSDVLESDSDISVINLGEVPRTKYHHSVHWYPNLSDVFESDSDISVISLGEVPRDVYCPNLADVSKPKSNISVFNFGNEQRRLPADLRLHLSDLEEEAGRAVRQVIEQLQKTEENPLEINYDAIKENKEQMEIVIKETRMVYKDQGWSRGTLEQAFMNVVFNKRCDLRRKEKGLTLRHREQAKNSKRIRANCPVESESDISLCTWREKPKVVPLVHVPKLDLTRLKKSRRRAPPPAPIKIPNCPVESESDISLCSWREKPKVIPLVHVPKLNLTRLKKSRRRARPPIKIPVASVESPEILSVESPEIRSVQKFGFLRKCLGTVCNFFTKCVKG